MNTPVAAPARGGPDRTVLVTGGTGFIGSAVVRAVTERADPPSVRVLTRKPLPQWMLDAGVVEVRGDLTDPRTLRGACSDVTTVLHLAAQVCGGRELCEAVNVAGTAALLDEVRRCDVRRVAYLSTTAVYGHGVHRGATESLLAPAPVSDTSRTRLLAERRVRAVGGTVLRPHLVYGPGDRWFLPTVFRLLGRLPAWIDRGAASASVISVEDLGRVVAALATARWGPARGAVFHVNDPEPVTFRELVGTALTLMGFAAPQVDVPADVARARLRSALPELSEHQFELVAADHWYDSSRIWRRTGVAPGPGHAVRMTAAVDWYRAFAERAQLTPAAV